MWGIRVVVPQRLRQQVLDELHLGHPGVVRMKSLARSHVWWPDIDKAVESCAKSCVACQCIKNAPTRAPWAWPTSPWERIHVDFLGPFLGRMLLVVMDAHSKWPEVCIMTSTTTAKTITVLRVIFARNGLPRQLIFDNGPQFVSEDFARFMAENGVKHLRTAPYHPASNGAAERLVQTVKQALRSAHQNGTPLEQALASFLLRYRSTPHATTGVPPCTMFLSRSLRTQLDLLTPNVGTRVRDQQTQQKDYSDEHHRERRLSVGQSVWARNFGEGSRWVRAKVLEQSDPVSFVLQLEDGRLWQRHVDHLRSGVLATPEYATVDFPCSLPAEPPLVAKSDSLAQPFEERRLGIMPQ
jgi:transposase InsO family protein